MMDREAEYELLHRLETETTKSRLRNFTAFLSISFVLPGLATRVGAEKINSGGLAISLTQAVFLLGFLFYCFAAYYYWWHHRYAHIYRSRLEDIERELGISIYGLRNRAVVPDRKPPPKWQMELHFHWTLFICGIVYFLIVTSYVGWLLMLATIAIVAVTYVAFMVASIPSRRRHNQSQNAKPQMDEPAAAQDGDSADTPSPSVT